MCPAHCSTPSCYLYVLIFITLLCPGELHLSQALLGEPATETTRIKGSSLHLSESPPAGYISVSHRRLLASPRLPASQCVTAGLLLSLMNTIPLPSFVQ